MVKAKKYVHATPFVCHSHVIELSPAAIQAVKSLLV